MKKFLLYFAAPVLLLGGLILSNGYIYIRFLIF